MPAIRQVAPIIFKEVFEAAEWKVYVEDGFTWSLVNPSGISIELPKLGRRVSFQVMENAMALAEMPPGEYFQCLAVVEESRRKRNLPIDGIDETGRPFRLN